MEFQKIIVQMLKVQMDHQQRMEEHRVQQQKEFQQRNEERLLQALMKRNNRTK